MCYPASGLGQLNICFPQGNNLCCVSLREKKLVYLIFHTVHLLFIKTDYNEGSPASFKLLLSTHNERGQLLITGHFDCQTINLFACLFKEPLGSYQLTCKLQTLPWYNSHPSFFDPLLIITFIRLFLDYALLKITSLQGRKAKLKSACKFKPCYTAAKSKREAIESENSWGWMAPLGISQSNLNSYGHLG